MILITILTICGDRLCPTRTAQCAGYVSWTASWKPDVNARQGHPAPASEYGWHDPHHLCPVLVDTAGHYRQFLP